ncbi:MAG TPA: TetR family transcriptional regulator [Pseudonocardia sp.]|uniref:TetR/AcrR family transcriptional regulator n=1 Tax=Pseudonocardia sp. TaxID=60912 RepID=UPI002BB5EE1F|nr:TetR family transcriptional regulator [Pseudonocardia sp.]HTF48901.1 TetR family transcriptional regulator [Pseudonocardia sp.]
MAGEARRSAVQAPPRGTRPQNRRQLILAAAADLFYRRGYSNVSMGEIAEAVAIGPSALYRHFRGKQELLSEVVLAAFGSARTALADAAGRDGVAAARECASAVLDHRELGVLWQREARHLPPAQSERLRRELRSIASLFTDLVRATRAELDPGRAEVLAWSVLAALVSVSFQQVRLPRPEYDELLETMVTRILGAPLSPAGPAVPLPLVPPVPVDDAGDGTRREVLVRAATRLFAERGYQGVGIEEIGAAAGISGPSIYHHFASKSQLLIAVLERGGGRLRSDLRRTLSTVQDPAAALAALLHSYIGFAMVNSSLVELLIIEVDQLPDEWRRVRQAQRNYVAEWVRLLRQVHPELAAGPARVLVQAALNVVNDLARTPHLREQPGLADAIYAVDAAILELPA